MSVEFYPSVGKVRDENGEFQDIPAFVETPDFSGVMRKPASTGSPGQILGLDNQLNPTWQDRDRVVTVTGTTPTITAQPGVRYVCGEVVTLDITLPTSGVIDVTFESGSTATVLTVTPPSGVTPRWANGFDPTALEANTTYEINITDGLGVVNQWGSTSVKPAPITMVPNAGSVSSAGVISIKHDSTELFTVQLPLYNGGVSNGA